MRVKSRASSALIALAVVACSAAACGGGGKASSANPVLDAATAGDAGLGAPGAAARAAAGGAPEQQRRIEQQRRGRRRDRIEQRIRDRRRRRGVRFRPRVQRCPGRPQRGLQGLPHVPRGPPDQHGHRHPSGELALGRLAGELFARSRVPAARSQHALQHRGREHAARHGDALRLQLHAVPQSVAVPGQRGHRRRRPDDLRRPPLPGLRRRQLQALRGLQHPLGLGDDDVYGGLGHRLGHDDRRPGQRERIGRSGLAHHATRHSLRRAHWRRRHQPCAPVHVHVHRARPHRSRARVGVELRRERRSGRPARCHVSSDGHAREAQGELRPDGALVSTAYRGDPEDRAEVRPPARGQRRQRYADVHQRVDGHRSLQRAHRPGVPHQADQRQTTSEVADTGTVTQD